MRGRRKYVRAQDHGRRKNYERWSFGLKPGVGFREWAGGTETIFFLDGYTPYTVQPPRTPAPSRPRRWHTSGACTRGGLSDPDNDRFLHASSTVSTHALQVHRIDLETTGGFGVSFATYGATLLSVRSADKEGKIEEVMKETGVVLHLVPKLAPCALRYTTGVFGTQSKRGGLALLKPSAHPLNNRFFTHPSKGCIPPPPFLN